MNRIEVFEVGPRDGFQSVPAYIPLETKLEIIEGIAEAGIRNIQITSFVSPKAIPQMRDAQDLAKICVEKYPDHNLFALVPNLKGAEIAWDIGIRTVSYVVSLSESHNRANINRSHQESLTELKRIIAEFPRMQVCLDLATTFGCPFEGKKSEAEIIRFIEPYVNLGIHQLDLCDTIGAANPRQVRQVIGAIQRHYAGLDLQIHIHDTRNMGMVNTLAAVECGVFKVQSTLGGLGGCPYAPGASGNLATEDLLFMLTEMGYETKVDMAKLLKTAVLQGERIPTSAYSGHLFRIGSVKGS